MTMTDQAWDKISLEYRVREAAVTQARLPSNDSRFLRFKGVMWPDYVQSQFTAYGRESLRVRPPLPQSRDIGRLDEVVDWFARYLAPAMIEPPLAPDTARIVWLRCFGMSWPKLIRVRNQVYGWHGGATKGKAQVPGGNSHVTLRRSYEGGLTLLSDGLNRDRVPVVL